MRRAVASIFVIVAGCGRLSFDARGDTSGSATELHDAVLIASLSTNVDDDDPEISFDGLEIYFSRALVTNEDDIYVSMRASVLDEWPAATKVPGINTGAIDKGPGLTSDALTLYFGSDRGGAPQKMYMTTRASRSDPWGAPVLVPELSLARNVGSPCVRGDRIVFRQAGGTGTHDLLHAELVGTTWNTPQLITELNTPGEDSGPFLFGDTLYFDSNRSGGVGSEDIYTAHWDAASGTFEPAVLDTTLSSTAQDTDVSLTADGNTIVFSRNIAGSGTGHDIYTATR
ncbi:MAG TPA: hypothetical protein VMZ53_02370 [Kofleriaceae bacterium]|nr:hypothetical protein [Kofleriaceae bacterium]